MATAFLVGPNGGWRRHLPFGERPQGSVVYTPGGWMSGTLAYADRTDLATGDVVGGSEEERTSTVGRSTFQEDGRIRTRFLQPPCLT
jgi:hypothetical protein